MSSKKGSAAMDTDAVDGHGPIPHSISGSPSTAWKKGNDAASVKKTRNTPQGLTSKLSVRKASVLETHVEAASAASKQQVGASKARGSTGPTKPLKSKSPTVKKVKEGKPAPLKKETKWTAKPVQKDQLAALNNIDGGTVDIEKLVQNEYSRLNRLYRLMESQRKKIAEAGAGVSKRGRVLQRLLTERDDLTTDILNANAPKWRKIDRADIKTIINQMELFEQYSSEVSICFTSIKEMDQNVSAITRKLVDQRLKMLASFGTSMTVPQANNHRSKLEDRLYHETTKFDTKVALNRGLREEVNMMLKLRGNFYDRLVSMKQQLTAIRTHMGEIVFSSTQAYESRDSHVTKIKILRDRNDKECRQHVLEMKEFTRVLHHDTKLHDFMDLKNKKRALLESQAQKYERQNIVKFEELSHILWSYNKTFRSILSASKFKSMHGLVSSYKAREQENYSYFKNLTDTDNEVEHLKFEVVNMQTEIQRIYDENKLREKELKAEIQKFGEHLQETNNQLDTELAAWDESHHLMVDTIRNLDAIFNLAECTNLPIIVLLGNKTGITPSNALLVMGAIEHQVAYFLALKTTLTARRQIEIEGKDPFVVLKGQGGSGLVPSKFRSHGGPFLPTITVTGHLGDGEDEDDDRLLGQRPLTYLEHKARIAEKINLELKGSSSIHRISRIDSSASTHSNADGAEAMRDRESWASVIPPSFH